MELEIKKCLKCGAYVRVFNDCTCPNCGIKCCNEEMVLLKPNSTDASFEKHLPTFKVEDDLLTIEVNHPMEEDHYIEWVLIVDNKNEQLYRFNAKEDEKVVVRTYYQKGMKVYVYCNKHNLWMKEVE